MLRRRDRSTRGSNPYEGLRTMALTEFGRTAAATDTDTDDDTLLGVVVDIPQRGGYATVVAMADGTTSMYTSTGGGVIGGGGRWRGGVEDDERDLVARILPRRVPFDDVRGAALHAGVDNIRFERREP